MEAPEYLDLDEIDFSDDSVYSVTSLKNIPELSRRSDGPAEDRPAPAINWSRGVPSHSGGGIKPTGLAEVHSKFRPVKRVSPLKHQPETTESDSDGKNQNQGPVLEQSEVSKDESSSEKQTGASTPCDGKAKVGGNAQALFGELEHYDLDMDEILDVPYIKSSQQMSTLPRVPHDRRSAAGGGAGGGTLERNRGGGGGMKSSTLTHNEPLSLGSSSSQTPPHLAADNLELIRDEDGNNLLHAAASQGHADCLQHLTSLMGEDGLNERNSLQLTPAGLGVKNGHLECVRWMVSETEAIAELSCTREHPSLIHYAARYGQEKVLLWLLQFMQEQAISLDEVDQNGNTAVHVAAQYGHLTCIQTLVEYGSNVTIQNQQGERPSQSAERQGHTTCARYLVVVETCMSLASQVVKLTKQLNEQTAERINLQKHLQRLMDPSKAEGTPSRSPSSHQPLVEACPELLLTAEAAPGDGHWLVRQGGVAPDSVLRQLLGKDGDGVRERLQPGAGLGREGPGAAAPGGHRTGLLERRELKLARLKQIMQRSLSESDSEGYPPEEGRNQAALRPDRPTHLPITEEEPASNHLHQVMRKHLPSSSTERKLAFSLSGSKSVDSIGYTPSPTSSDPDATETRTPETPAADGQKVATSPKSALKSPSSRRKTSQNLKLRVTFDEQVHKSSSSQEPEPSRAPPGKDRTAAASSEGKRSFGTFRSIMETLSGNSNHSNNNSSSSSSGGPVKPSAYQNSPGRKSVGGGAKGKSRVSNV
uniref:Synphilin-1 alpha-Synuclein-binding domain-containing protein n=1 Tax=Poecilia mexicana TaxID=48701 RepID=A0A3B3YID6_9TELE